MLSPPLPLVVLAVGTEPGLVFRRWGCQSHTDTEERTKCKVKSNSSQSESSLVAHRCRQISQLSQQIMGVPSSGPLHAGQMHTSGPSLTGGAVVKVEEMVTMVGGGGAFAQGPGSGCRTKLECYNYQILSVTTISKGIQAPLTCILSYNSQISSA